jgi:hypothetical protein
MTADKRGTLDRVSGITGTYMMRLGIAVMQLPHSIANRSTCTGLHGGKLV